MTRQFNSRKSLDGENAHVWSAKIKSEQQTTTPPQHKLASTKEEQFFERPGRRRKLKLVAGKGSGDIKGAATTRKSSNERKERWHKEATIEKESRKDYKRGNINRALLRKFDHSSCCRCEKNCGGRTPNRTWTASEGRPRALYPQPNSTCSSPSMVGLLPSALAVVVFLLLKVTCSAASRLRCKFPPR